jgi:sugar phosphate permease
LRDVHDHVHRSRESTAAPELQKDLGLSHTELGLVFSAFAVPYGFLQPFGGWLGDRFGPRWVLFAVGALWAAVTWLPSILAASYHLSVKKFVWFTAGVLLAGVIGDTAGGLLADFLLVRTGNLKFARRLILVVGLLGSLLFLLPTLFIHNLITVSILLSLAFFFLESTTQCYGPCRWTWRRNLLERQEE